MLMSSMEIKVIDKNTGRTMTMYKDNVMDAMKALQRYLNQQKYDRNSSIYRYQAGYALDHNSHTWIAIEKRTQHKY